MQAEKDVFLPLFSQIAKIFDFSDITNLKKSINNEGY